MSEQRNEFLEEWAATLLGGEGSVGGRKGGEEEVCLWRVGVPVCVPFMQGARMGTVVRRRPRLHTRARRQPRTW